jgi:hypothetical protein
MRRDVQEIFKMTPHEKQVMMFSATLPKDLRAVSKKFMQDVRSAVCFVSIVGGTGRWLGAVRRLSRVGRLGDERRSSGRTLSLGAAV